MAKSENKTPAKGTKKNKAGAEKHGPEPTGQRANGGNESAFHAAGKMSTFGGPFDFGVGPNEGLAFFYRPDLESPAYRSLFLPTQPPGTTGLARRLNPDRLYIACRWNYNQTSREFLRNCVATVTNPQNNRSAEARPADWGPSIATGRVADLSPGLAAELGLETDDDCVVQIERPDEAQDDVARGPSGGGQDDGHGTGNPPPDIIHSRRSPYHSSRNNGDINAIVLHYTTGSTTDGTLSWFERNPDSVSAHYVIGRDGAIYQMVDDTERANHCVGANRHSIGIEPGWWRNTRYRWRRSKVIATRTAIRVEGRIALTPFSVRKLSKQ
ncbi:MAG: N-acetylmuramoyl-L-alanine amidase [Verrucomicrobiaceae bacterium]|nr:N-acetylmuramoyl-L-alanine amidase [Verrucomicrobiaceae bacterium]